MNTPENFETFDNLVSLPHYVTIFVPSTVNVNKVDDQLSADTLDYVMSTLIDLFGGATQNATSIGGWNSDTLGHVLEDVTPVTVYLSDLSREVQIEIIDVVRYIKTTMKQESIFLVVDGVGKLYF